MMRLFMNAGGAWQCHVHAQPMLNDLYSSINNAGKPHNLRGMHLAGHATSKCGVVWNADNAEREKKEFDVDAISIRVRGECRMSCVGRHPCRMIQPTQPGSCSSIFSFFYRTVVEDGSGARDNQRSFFAATHTAAHTMRLTAHTGGAAQRTRGEKDSEDAWREGFRRRCLAIANRECNSELRRDSGNRWRIRLWTSIRRRSGHIRGQR